MGEAVARAVADSITHMIFGDLYLADIRPIGACRDSEPAERPAKSRRRAPASN